ncbi:MULTISPECIES: SET domain-containing protein [Paraburkholderia]|uniref:SET domain-containing protein n=1 Tax=Paraburkholderia TaxID=1822464 RepID=UPI001655FA36|nr:SET domain-containing protein-lysine N-methyltransferase [Paraburkholderia podalyriae]
MTQTVRNSRPRFVTRRSPVHGRGLFANRAIAAAELVCEYKGARVTWREVLRRCARDTSESDHTFYFDLDDGTVIDGGEGGNNARWLNHGCVPNCEAEIVDRRVFIRALRDIAPGEELTIDYALSVEGRHTAELRARFRCHCAAPGCRGTMLQKRRTGRRKVVANDAVRKTASDPQAVGAGAPRGAAGESAVQQQRQHAAPTVRIMERPDTGSIVVTWREPGRCCYTEQLWKLTRAPSHGQCAFSGIPVHAGDCVYMPCGDPRPVNADSLITEESIAGMTVGDGCAA